MTFTQLIERIVGPFPPPTQFHGPLIASATEGANPIGSSPLWVILHSITDSDLRLIHPRPLVGDELAVQISLHSGEILRVTLSTADSKRNGELYETTARFL
jgi:hypothetical protein